MIVTVRDARCALGEMNRGYCISGLRMFCQVHNIDFKKAIVEGIDSEELRKTGDPLALKMIEEAERHG